jgi:hypothetical protein
MHTLSETYRLVRWERNLEELDGELARLATVCRVKILDPGVIDRLLSGDDSDCGANNALAFRKLHDLLMMYFLMRQKTAAAFGQQQTTAIELDVIERLKKRFPDLATDWGRV